jgi:hypothetical protein
MLLFAAERPLVLLLPIVLSIYNPRGRTSYGWRKQQIQNNEWGWWNFFRYARVKSTGAAGTVHWLDRLRN